MEADSKPAKKKRDRKVKDPQKRGPKLKAPVTDKDFETFESLCKIQCTLHEIAAFFDIDTNTLESRVRERYGRKFSEVFKDKRQLGNVSLRRKQYEKALEGNTTMLIWLGKQYLKQLDRIEGINIPDSGREKNTLTDEELKQRIDKRLERRNERERRQGATAG